MEVTETVILHGDNEMSIALTKNAESKRRTKHIDVQNHYIRELIEEGELTVSWIPGSQMLADGMTKALPTEMFRKHRALLIAYLLRSLIETRLSKSMPKGDQA